MTVVSAALMGVALFIAPTQAARETVTTLIQKIQRADYEGDRATLRRLHGELVPFMEHKELASRILYWRGFAMWRRALNGFNESADRTELAEDLMRCVEDFRAALVRDPDFVDARGGAASCLVNHSFLIMRSDGARARELFQQSADFLREALAAAPNNPRLLWVQGANQFYTPPERGGGHALAIATYERGLEIARQQKGRVTDPLEPTWGEPELLMNLAFANLNKPSRDVRAAERYAEQALALVPYWHYVRDILLAQIRKEKRAG
jgi:tetratricopeptide (TPR) repeat protein